MRNGQGNEERYLLEVLLVPMVSEVLTRLRRELPRELLYHSLEHTYEVLQESMRLAAHDGIEKRERLLLGIAAAFHDTGFLVRRENNEELGAKFALEAMRKEGSFHDSELELVATMIQDTQIRPNPDEPLHRVSAPLSGYLADADLSNVGRDDFMLRAELLRLEEGLEPLPFWRQTEKLLLRHSYITPAGIALREARKRENISVCRNLIALLEDSQK